jgi:elongation factor Ts
VIPGNDDSSRAIRLYARGIADAYMEGRNDSGEGDRDGRRRVRRARGSGRSRALSPPLRLQGAPSPFFLTEEFESMAEITAGMVRELREKTDAPMMECKKALTEAAGDMAKAEEILRVKLGNKASKAAGRVAAEGVVAAHVSGDAKLGAIVEVNCETDFVAKNEEFLAFARQLAELVTRENPADVTALAGLASKAPRSKSAARRWSARSGRTCRCAASSASTRAASSPPIYTAAPGSASWSIWKAATKVAKDIAMHIAASKPLALHRDEVSPEIVQKERNIAAAKAAESGKPANIVEKMVEGSVQKFLKEVTLLAQPFVKNDKQTVEDLLKSHKASVAAFVLYVVGEGIERRKDDFAAEVMSQVGQAGKS